MVLHSAASMPRWYADVSKADENTVEAQMTEQEIINITNKVFEESFEIEKEKLLPDAQIFSDLGLDSLDAVDLVVALEKNFGVKIRDHDKVRDIRTLQDVYQFILDIKKQGVQ
jgi:acyl carrier protein